LGQEVIADSFGWLFGKPLVVFVATNIIRMALNFNLQTRICQQEARELAIFSLAPGLRVYLQVKKYASE
jgi:hypothetical protein